MCYVQKHYIGCIDSDSVDLQPRTPSNPVAGFTYHDFEPISSILVLTGIVAILVVVGFVIACSIFAAIALALIAAGIGLFVAGLSVFWPAILFTLVIFILVRDKQTPA